MLPDHALRLDIKNFTKGVVVIDNLPTMMTGAEVRQYIDGQSRRWFCGIW
jgi:hypothetical protein